MIIPRLQLHNIQVPQLMLLESGLRLDDHYQAAIE